MEARRQFSRLGWAYVIFFLVSSGAQYVLGLLLVSLQTAGLGRLNMNVLMLLSQFAMYGIGFPVFCLMIRRIPSWERAGVSVGVGRMILCTVFCFGVTYMGNIIGQILMRTAGLLSGNVFENPLDNVVLELSPWAILLSTVLIAPVMEELMFRKLLLDRTVQYGQRMAVIISGVGFGLFHGNFFQFFYACAIGMVFAYLYSSTGRIRYSIILHMIINFMGGFVSLMMIRGMAAKQIWAQVWLVMQVALMLGSMVAAIVLACIYGRRLSWFPSWEQLPERGRWRTVLLAPGIIGFLVMSAAIFVLAI